MCTVSLVSTGDRLRLMCNRDEQHARPEACHPRAQATRDGFALLPIDPRGCGTWIAATSSGLVLAVLNGDGPAPPGAVSRGRLIPALLDGRTIAEVVERADDLRHTPWPAHRIVVASRARAVELRVRGRGVSVREMSLSTPLMLTSSSFEAGAVIPERRALFTSTVVESADPLAAQDAFHRSRIEGRAWASVDMRRHDAATHSITTVDISLERIAMRYEPLRHLAGAAGWISLPRPHAMPASLSKVS